jgi:hypothetical protein
MHSKMCARTRSAVRWWIGRTFRSIVLSERNARSTLASDLRRRHRGADDVEAAQCRLGLDADAVAREAEGVVGDGQLEVLGHPELDDLAHAQADLVAPGELARVHPGLDLGQVELGGRKQLLALVRAQLGQFGVAARHEPLAPIQRRAEFEQVALVEQIELKLALLDQRGSTRS